MTDAPEFAAVAGLIALVTDAKACAKRFDELRSLSDQIAKSQAKLDSARAEHDRAAAAAQADILAREQKLRQREQELLGRESMLRHSQAIIDRWKAEHDFADSDIQPGSTLRRARAS
jgi:hypothetical protein